MFIFMSTSILPLPSDIVGRLLSWIAEARRDLPWRHRRDPYAVWVSEIMLQQTTVATVKSYYANFLARWPTVEALAAAPLDGVLAAWAGLGYYARARNLHACAKIVARDFGARFPRDEAALRALPGVGPYTAAAIAAIAFNAPCVPVDGNVERVMARLHAIETPPREAKPLIRDYARAMAPPARAGDFAQALMDLGATVCAPRAPKCSVCPLAPACEAKKRGAVEAFPVKAARPAKPLRRGAIFIMRKGDTVLLERRPPKGLFGGMAVFPSTPLTQDIAHDALNYAPCRANWRMETRTVSHVFTHFALEATIYVARAPRGKNAAAGDFAPINALAAAGLPSLMRKAALCAGLTKG
ncbi:MAG: A/G-specific adenine glycosylase [Methylocystis sp.]|nr:A/G-specific adenine glycosylase [Methylocystis sp.]